MSGDPVATKTIVITGATSGIGRSAAAQLAGQGARVILACRDMSKAESARQEILQETGSNTVETVRLDLESFDSVRNCAQSISNRAEQLDVLVNNAGVMPLRAYQSRNGFEIHMAVNFLGHFLLTHLLLEKLHRSPSARIVHVASLMHRGGAIKFEYFKAPRFPFWPVCYNDSKLANVIFSNELARRLKGTNVTSNALHPGTVTTNIVRTFPAIAPHAMKLFALTPQQGGAFITHAATAPELEGKSGLYIAKGKIRNASSASRDPILGRALWDHALDLCGLST